MCVSPVQFNQQSPPNAGFKFYPKNDTISANQPQIQVGVVEEEAGGRKGGIRSTAAKDQNDCRWYLKDRLLDAVEDGIRLLRLGLRAAVVLIFRLVRFVRCCCCRRSWLAEHLFVRHRRSVWKTTRRAAAHTVTCHDLEKKAPRNTQEKLCSCSRILRWLESAGTAGCAQHSPRPHQQQPVRFPFSLMRF